MHADSIAKFNVWSTLALSLVVAFAMGGVIQGALAPPTIPLERGLTIVSAFGSVAGDLEEVDRVMDVSNDGVSLSLTAEVPDVPAKTGGSLGELLGGEGVFGGKRPNAKSASPAPATKHIAARRIVRREDMQNAHEFMQPFFENDRDLYSGTTAVTVSTAVLNDLRKKGETELTVGIGSWGIGGSPDALDDVLSELGDFAKELNKLVRVSGTLKRVEPGAVAFKVLVNDVPMELPAIHARGQLAGMSGTTQYELWVMDDPNNPLVLKTKMTGFGDHQIVKLSWTPSTATTRPADPTSALGRALEKDRRATVYGIYFDFASDRIKKESDRVLAEIAKVLTDNPAWSLAVEGHTDAIGGDQQNLDLSKRRAAAVKEALTKRYKIAPNRLTTDGYGRSRPVDTNDTLEGRARNRRVELVRQS